MTKRSAQQVSQRHFFAWFIALFVFAFFEWRHPGFVSYVIPFPVVVFIPGVFLLAEYGWSFYRLK